MFGKKTKCEAMQDAVQDAAHEAKDAVAAHFETAREKASDKAQETGERLHGWKDSVADAATSAWGVMAHKAGDLAHDLAQRATEAAHKASEAAHDRLDEPAHIAAQRAAEAAQAARERLSDARHQAADRAQDAKARASEMARGAAAHAPLLWQNAAQNAAHKAGTIGIKAGKALHDRAAQYVPDYIPEVKIVDKKADFTTKLLWLAVGVFTGVALGILLAPASGRRSRAAVRDKLTKAGHDAGELGNVAKKKAEDLTHRAAGLAHDLKDRVHPSVDAVDDATIEARVRTALGHNAALSNLARFNVDVIDGSVTLRGPMVDEATRAGVESVVRAIAGVRDVTTALLVETAEEEQTFVG